VEITVAAFLCCEECGSPPRHLINSAACGMHVSVVRDACGAVNPSC
jgi:hypothetical protein